MTRTRRACTAVLMLGFMPAAGRAVTVGCTAAANGIAFGIYNPLSPTGNALTGAISVTCTGSGGGSMTETVGVSLSAGASGAFATRTMLSGSNPLAYNIYWDAAHTIIMGDGTGGSYSGIATFTVVSGRSVLVTGTMYGYLPRGQNAGPGGYTDIITMTVTY